ncbi:MAG: triose-phosphate isomerase [Halofilum sp. (in: g-proteobacteria)]|nr:triose-phosphate isomerase [Halofilum sp. (in: g-proteobacteria)]
MRRPLVAGNWKLNGTRSGAASLAEAVRAGCGAIGAVDVVLCPVFVHIPVVAEQVAGSPVRVGSQDVSAEAKGAFTGEVAAAMLAEFDCGYAIVGHSERRARHGETDAVVAAKFAAAVAAGLVPIVCVGETLAQRDAGESLAVTCGQLEAVLDAVGNEGFGAGVVAYEPVWAIGTGRTATPEQAQEVHAALRGVLAARDPGLARDTRIVYGGSVKAANAPELFASDDIDGALVGGASLDSDEFLAICRAAGEAAVAG